MSPLDNSLMPPRVHYSPLLPPTPSAAGSQDALLSNFTPIGDPQRIPGSSVADAPPHVRQVLADNPSDATNSDLDSLKPLVITEELLRVRPEYKKYDDLKFWPTILQPKAITLLILLYMATAVSIGVLMWKSMHDKDGQFELSSENVRMISRYFPSIIGTITVLLYRQTVREALRMEPFTRMADQKRRETPGEPPAQGVGGAWFPWQDLRTAPVSFFSVSALLLQVLISFLVSLKVALLASKETVKSNEHFWVLTVRLYPAAALIFMYICMTLHTLYLYFGHVKGRSTGLKWDPVSIADFAALFARCNALQYFAPLELRHNMRPEHVMPTDRLFRLGYWTRKRENSTESDIVYGVGVGFSAHQGMRKTPELVRPKLGRPWWHKIIRRRPKPKPLDAPCQRPKNCGWGSWPNCEHYPYKENPGCSRFLIFCCSVPPMAALAFSIYLLTIGQPFTGFELENRFRFPNKISVNISNTGFTLPPIDPADPDSNVLVWALLFRSAPTYVAGIFTSTIITWIDLNMRFMQPFRNMMGEGPKRSAWQRVGDFFGLRHRRSTTTSGQSRAIQEDVKRKSAKAADSILLAYISSSPAQVPLTAWDNGHLKVCIYSTLNTLSPLFPIFVGAILTVSPSEDLKKVKFTFSLSAYIGVMVFLFLFSTLLPVAIPGAYRLLPRQLYSLADLIALCHESKFMASLHLDIADPERTPSKEHMEARILLEDGYFLFGEYTGRDNRPHIGFDITQKREGDFGRVKEIKKSVRYIHPEGFGERFARTMTVLREEGLGAYRSMTGAWRASPGSPFSQRRHGILEGETAYEMVAEASGSQVRSDAATGETRTTQAGARKPLPPNAVVRHSPYEHQD